MHTAVRKKVSTSVDLPLSPESNRVLECASESARDKREIGTGDLLLGILHVENSFATVILHQYGLSRETVREGLLRAGSSEEVKNVQSKPTACRNCKHLVVAGRIKGMNLFCGASPLEPEFDCYTGAVPSKPSVSPAQRFKRCDIVNFGDCELFEPKEG